MALFTDMSCVLSMSRRKVSDVPSYTLPIGELYMRCGEAVRI